MNRLEHIKEAIEYRRPGTIILCVGKLTGILVSSSLIEGLHNPELNLLREELERDMCG